MITFKTKQSIFERFPILKAIPEERFPSHVFIIPDGNGRWAKEHRKLTLEGHTRGMQVLRNILRELSELKQIKIVTLFAFSADNWKRNEKEVQGLMRLLTKSIETGIVEIKNLQGRFFHLGRKDRIPKALLDIINKAEKDTEKNTGQIVCVAIDFGGEDQEIRVVEKARILNPTLSITKDIVWSLRDGKGFIPSADLLIRTSGEKRTSDIGWINGVSTELFFIDKFFPDITVSDIVDAIIDFSRRERRFGGRK